MGSLSVVLVFMGILVVEAFCIENPTVTIDDGSVLGISNTTVEGNTTYYAFRGIPYAKPPTGQLRFKSPQKPEPWNGTLNGTVDGADCIQMADGSVVGSEDCLFINVYTPALYMNSSLAVMVWIYGGSFTSGSASYETYRPDYFLDEGILYVSFNYRLGPLGWLSTDDEYCPGNFGLKDQILALKWVQDNIAYFGGDPANVTIFGESAGSASVSYLLQSNQTEGLFAAAIMESGTSLNLWALQTNPSIHAFKLGVQLAIITDDSETLIAGLMNKTAADIVEAADTVNNLVSLANPLTGLTWAPVVEPWSNQSAFSGQSHELLINGNFRKVPLIVGFNSNELGGLNDILLVLAVYLFTFDLDYSKLTPADLTDNPVHQLAAGVRIKNRYFGALSMVSQPQNVIPFVNIDLFNRPIREFVNLTSRHTDVYFYRFNHVGALGGPLDDRSYWGVAHAEELNYLFVSDNNGTNNDHLVRKRMVKMWANFAKHGEPKYSSDSTLFSTNTTSTWVPARESSFNGTLLDSSTDLLYMNITSSLLMASYPNQTDYEFYRDDIFYGIYGKKQNYTTF